MTAEVLIFNKSAIALAADSAVSIVGRDSSKVYNNAEKLFALSKHHPVAVMIYERNELQGVPWELIIKAFRKNQGEQCYSTLSEYKDAFLNFAKDFYFGLQTEKIKFWTRESIKEVVLSTLTDVRFMINPDSFDDEIRDIDVFDIAINSLLDCYQDMPYFPNLNDNSLEEFELNFEKFAIEIMADQLDSSNFSEKEGREWINTCHSFYVLCKARLLRQDPHFNGATGLVFAGYGEDEYFPSFCECEVQGAIAGQLKIIEREMFHDPHPTSGLKAFAQKEEVHAFMEGIGESTKNKMFDMLDKMDDNQESDIEELISKYVPENAQAAALDEIKQKRTNQVNEFLKDIQEYTHKYHINKVIDMVEHLPKNELAYMAESLVNLTAFKRKVSHGLDSVGGPIDVAIISKGDGLVWIKRKHYFPAEFNVHYGPSK